MGRASVDNGDAPSVRPFLLGSALFLFNRLAAVSQLRCSGSGFRVPFCGSWKSVVIGISGRGFHAGPILLNDQPSAFRERVIDSHVVACCPSRDVGAGDASLDTTGCLLESWLRFGRVQRAGENGGSQSNRFGRAAVLNKGLDIALAESETDGAGLEADFHRELSAVGDGRWSWSGDGFETGRMRTHGRERSRVCGGKSRGNIQAGSVSVAAGRSVAPPSGRDGGVEQSASAC